MWGRRRKHDIVADSIAETQTARTMIDQSGDLLVDIESELLQILSGGARAEMAAVRKLINKIERRA